MTVATLLGRARTASLTKMLAQPPVAASSRALKHDRIHNRHTHQRRSAGRHATPATSLEMWGGGGRGGGGGGAQGDKVPVWLLQQLPKQLAPVLAALSLRRHSCVTQPCGMPVVSTLPVAASVVEAQMHERVSLAGGSMYGEAGAAAHHVAHLRLHLGFGDAQLAGEHVEPKSHARCGVR